MKLLFMADRLPRSMTRAKWRELHRWRRTTERRLREANARALENLVLFGSSVPSAARERMIERVINPPLLVHPAMLACAFCGAEWGHSPSCTARRDLADIERRFAVAREGGA